MAYCPRCLGRKSVYKIGGGYSLEDMGGVLIDCPLCKGTGKFTSLGDEIKALKEELADNRESSFSEAPLKRKRGRRPNHEPTSEQLSISEELK